MQRNSVSGVAAAAPDLEFTGERIVPGKTPEPLFREHEERYVFAGQYVAGKDVLDLACGSGVGTSFLRQAGARSVRGLDIDPEAIAFARARYRDCEFAECEATNLCLPDNSIDVVVSFETLEHLKDQRKFLMECRRVLRPGGVMICSTPNRTIYRWQGANPYHVHELTAREFVDLVGTYFGESRLFSQAEQLYPFYALIRIASRILGVLKLKSPVKKILGFKAPAGGMREGFFWEGRNGIREIEICRKPSLKQPIYLIAVGRKVSNREQEIEVGNFGK